MAQKEHILVEVYDKSIVKGTSTCHQYKLLYICVVLLVYSKIIFQNFCIKKLRIDTKKSN